MPLLGFFSRKDKSKSSASRSSVSTYSKEDDAEPTDAGFVLSPSSTNLPSLTNGNAYGSSSNASLVSAGSSSKLKLPFKRRPPVLNSPLSTSSYSISTSNAHEPSTVRSVLTSESSLSISPSRPPVFPSFHGVGTPPSSTRSLPSEAQQRPHPSPLQNDEDQTVKGKSGGIFGWKNRERKKSKATKPELDGLTIPPTESFHLMSFRHIQAGSPTTTPSKRESLESPAAPYVTQVTRPRGDSMASSDSTQRISVAAFREAQARRSSTNLARGSPSPQPLPRPISVANSINSETPPPRPPRAARPPAAPSPRDSKSSSAFSAIESSTSESSSEEESDSEGQSPSRSRSRLSRQRTITKRSYRASSDLGHGASNHSTHHQQRTSTRSEVGHDSASRTAHPSPSRGPPPSSFQKSVNAFVGTRSFSLYRRQRASYSTSELSPTAAAKRASVVAAANNRDSKESVRKPGNTGSDTSESSSENGSSDEDAPLASLVPPKRPGSSASRISSPNASPAMRPKPLIDLNTKFNPITGKPARGASGTEEDKQRYAPVLSPTNISERLARVTASAGLTSTHRDLNAAKSEDNLTRPSRKSSLNWRELRLENSDSPDSPDSGKTAAPLPPRFRTHTSPALSDSARARSNSASPAISPSKIDTNVIPPVPVLGAPQDNAGFRVLSRPRKQSSSSGSPVSPANFPDNMPPKDTEAPAPVRHHRPQSTSFVVVSRPQSILPSLDTKPLVVPQDESKNRTSVMSVPPISQNSRAPPQRPFVSGRRQESPASSTGGSSNGKGPLTPNDGSDYFTPEVRANGDSPSGSAIGVPSAMKGGRPRHAKRASGVSFQDVAEGVKVEKDRGRSQSNAASKQTTSLDDEESRRRERRRSEAKAAIELGNVINGKMPLEDDDDDNDGESTIGATMGPRMSMMNPMIFQNGMPNGMNFNMPLGWQQPGMSPQMAQMGMGNMSATPQQFMIPPPPPNADPAYLVAHRQALMVAKQAYQYAVAQQAMAAAGEEWERGSSVSGFTPSNGMNMMNGMNFGMNGMGGMSGLSPAMAGMWGNRPMFAQGPQSTYAGSNIGAASELGWGSASVYGENFGPSLTSATRRAQATSNPRKSVAGDLSGIAFPTSFQRSESSGNLNGAARNPPVRSAPRQRTRTAPSNGRLPEQQSRIPPMPPSSWKV